MYMYKDDSGKILLTDRPRTNLQLASVDPSELKDLANHRASGTFKPSLARPEPVKELKFFTRYNSSIKRAAKKYRLDHRLISAVVQVESQFNPMALSRTGAMGLMQLMPSTAKQLGVENPYNPEQNIEGGAKYLRYLVERFNGDVTLALAAYNSGPLNVEKYGKVPPFAETKRYVSKIYDLYKGSRKINLSATGGNSIRRITLDDGTIVYTDYLQNGSPRF